MVFSELSPVVQELLLLDFNFKAKVIMLGGMLIFTLFYILYLHEKIKTPYIFTSILKTLTKVFCWVYVIATPLMSFLLSPLVSLDRVVIALVSIYFVSITLGIVWLVVNILYYSPLFLIRYLGIDLEDERNNKVLSKIDRVLFGNLGKLKVLKVKLNGR